MEPNPAAPVPPDPSPPKVLALTPLARGLPIPASVLPVSGGDPIEDKAEDGGRVELDIEVGKEEYMLVAVVEEEDQNDPKPRSEDVVDCCGR